jgi:hypothetical protein
LLLDQVLSSLSSCLFRAAIEVRPPRYHSFEATRQLLMRLQSHPISAAKHHKPLAELPIPCPPITHTPSDSRQSTSQSCRLARTHGLLSGPIRRLPESRYLSPMPAQCLLIHLSLLSGALRQPMLRLCFHQDGWRNGILKAENISMSREQRAWWNGSLLSGISHSQGHHDRSRYVVIGLMSQALLTNVLLLLARHQREYHIHL